MSAKISFLLAIAVAIVVGSASATTCTSSSPHTAHFGTRKYGDQMLYSDSQSMSSKLLKVVTKDVSYPAMEVRGIISYIEIIDNIKSSKGGCGSILSGGLGSDHVTLHLKSQRGNGFSFDIRIYGQPRW